MSWIRYTLLWIFLLLGPFVYGQGEDNIWFFGTRGVVDFNSGVPVVNRQNPKNRLTGGPGYYSHGFGIQAGICDASGKLRFFVHYRSYGQNEDYRSISKVFDSSGYEMPHGNIDMHLSSSASNESPLIVPWPGHPDQYFLFYARTGGLLYSLVDMRLNNGKGDVDTNVKDVLLSGYGTVHDQRLAAVQGCNGIWVVTKSAITNGFRVYLVDEAGVHTEPVLSRGIDRPQYPYNDTQRIYRGYGRVVASNDGRKIAVATQQGIELYDFEKCSGRLKNPVIIDTSIFQGLSFSPDNTKLYASAAREYDSSRLPFPYLPGRVYQFDLSLNDPILMARNRILILEAATSACLSDKCFCGLPCFCDTNSSFLGDLRLGPDKKIYVLNNFVGCGLSSRGLPGVPTQPVGYTPLTAYVDSDFLYVIHEPNLLGWACRPEINYLNVTPNPRTGGPMDRWLPLPIALPPPAVDTLQGRVEYPVACFVDSITLTAHEAGECYLWDDGSTEQHRTVTQPGIYTVGYYLSNCSYQVDTYHVSFPKLPVLGASGFSCAGHKDGKIRVMPQAGDTSSFNYQWTSNTGVPIGQIQSDTAFEIRDLAPGHYLLRIRTISGCDTTLLFNINELPQPQSYFEADSAVCVHTPVSFTTTNTEPYLEWHFGDGVVAYANRTPVHIYKDTGRYAAMLIVENFEGCRDSFTQQILVKDLHLQLVANKQQVTREEMVQLKTDAHEPYRILAWLPAQLFAEQTNYVQEIQLDTSRTIQVVGISEIGCIDTTSVFIQTHPVIHIPTAFSPNGDGVNDYFRPYVYGGNLTIQSFQVFDRWGKLVWEDKGQSNGWDGTYHGVPCELGTYFYQIEGAEHTGRKFRQRGDVTLVR